MKYKVGFDLDGVIAKECWLLHWIFRFLPSIGVYIRDNYVPVLYLPAVPGFIITGRPEIDRVSTTLWLHRNKVNFLELCMSPSFDKDAVVSHKRSIIESLNLDYFVESDEYQILQLQKLCKCNIVTVKQALELKFIEESV